MLSPDASRLVARLAHAQRDADSGHEARGRAETPALTSKFGELSADEKARVRGTSVKELQLYADRVLTAASLGAVFGEVRPFEASWTRIHPR